MGSLRKNNFSSKVSLIITLLIIAAAYYGIPPVIAEDVTLAPLNPAFFNYVQERHVLGEQRLTLDGKTLGYIPSPLDLSHLKGSFLGQVHRLLGAPTSYDLRSLGKLTPVKDQGDCGSCWSFAAYGSLESDLLPSETWDFSENNLKNTHGFDWGYCDGGNAFISSAYLARWSGPITESDDPYNPSSGSSPSGLTPQKHQQEILIIPDRSGPLDNENIKQMVMTYGAVYTTMYYGSSYYNYKFKTYYYNGSSYSNHAVAIVGWDDYFDGRKFGDTPPGDGAFIIRNSWGASWGESGYFYISYYDSNIGAENFVFNYAESTTNYGNIYQYDPLGWVSSVGYGSNTAWFANIFTADESEQLSAVSFYTASPDATYEIYIYTNVTSNPISGSFAGSKTGTISIPGYHTINLDSLVPITSGQKFSVVAKLTTPGYNYPIAMESREMGYSSDAAAGAGQSYISGNGSNWTDITSYYSNSNVCLKAFTSGTGGCTYSLSPTSEFPASGGTGSVSVTTQSECDWTATSNDTSWITVTSGVSGTGNGTVDYSVAANTGTSRTGTMTIAGRTFTVNQSAPAPTITVTVPNGGETWTAGITQTISWSYTGNPGTYVKIELLKDGVLNRSITTRASTVIGYYNWTIPSTQAGGTDYRIRVTSRSSASVTDTSNGDFTILGPTITGTSPNGGESWTAGTTQTISWSYTRNPGTYVKIELLKDGVLNRTITTRASTVLGYYNWTIPSTQVQGSDYRIKVTSTSNRYVNDTSDADFSILKL